MEKNRFLVTKKHIVILSSIIILIVSLSIGLYMVLKPKEQKKYDLEEQLIQGYKINYYNTKEDISNFRDEWKKSDLDSDSISNEDEYVKYNTNPYSDDSDSDGLTDYEEIFTYNSSPINYSSLGDGISDYVKVKNNIDIYKTLSEDAIYNIDEITLNNIMSIKPKNINYKDEYKYEIFMGTAFNKYTRIIQPFYLYSFKGTVKINLEEQINKYNTNDYTVVYWDYSDNSIKKIDSKMENNTIIFDLNLDMYNPIAIIMTSEYDKNITSSKEYESRYISPNNTCDGLKIDNLYKTTYNNSIDTFSFDNFVPTNNSGTPTSNGICFGMAYTQMLRYNYKNNNRELSYDNTLGIPNQLNNNRSYNYTNNKDELNSIFNEPGNFSFDTTLIESNNGIIVDGYKNTKTGTLFNVLMSFQTNQETLYKNRMSANVDSVMDDLSCSINDNQISNINICYNYDGTSESCHSVNALGLEKSSVDNSYRIYISDTNLTTLTKNLTIEQMPYILLTPYIDGKFVATLQTNSLSSYESIQNLYDSMNITRVMINLPYVENEKLTYYSNSYNLNNIANNINKDSIDTTNVSIDTKDDNEFIESGNSYKFIDDGNKLAERVRITSYWQENFRTGTSPDFGATLSCRNCDYRGYWLNSNGWWMLRWWHSNGYWIDSLVVATANSQWPDSPNRNGISAGGTWNYLHYIKYRNDWAKFEVEINGWTYKAINLDLCGACSWSKERRGDSTNNRIDVYVKKGYGTSIPDYGYAT